MKKILPMLIALALSGAANAATYTYELGDLMTGGSSVPDPSKSFATLTVDDSASKWVYTLTVGAKSEFDALFGGNAFVGALGIGPEALKGTASLATGTWGVKAVGVSKGGGAGDADIASRFTFGKGAKDRLVGGETVSWTSAGVGDASDLTLALHVQGIGAAGQSGWYGTFATNTLAPVPEPETYVMLLSGLGLIGTIARRRAKAKAA